MEGLQEKRIYWRNQVQVDLFSHKVHQTKMIYTSTRTLLISYKLAKEENTPTKN